ncbi:hypothetical protein B0H67DRAFT_645474 [Lasiosphaeris hirsuta]|uniref:Uncharacterized protein n=1 Tax=Lasiosphaeris hirsuta TaxID=260670 RepID=A0AA40DXZ5_9PEZI|nr:hypothetical protein B0H67DRAFT_645474 [Lasiosphaeris hirsuta]
MYFKALAQLIAAALVSAPLASAQRVERPGPSEYLRPNTTGSHGDGNTTAVTTVVSRFTTICPSPTTWTWGTKTYCVTEPTTLTITDCPCTITTTHKPCYDCHRTTHPPPEHHKTQHTAPIKPTKTSHVIVSGAAPAVGLTGCQGLASVAGGIVIAVGVGAVVVGGFAPL